MILAGAAVEIEPRTVCFTNMIQTEIHLLVKVKVLGVPASLNPMI